MNRRGWLGRRAFLHQGILLLGSASLASSAAEAMFVADSKSVRLGLVTDLHHADKPAAGSRYYRETLGKFAEAAQAFHDQRPDFIVELGDFIDAADSVTSSSNIWSGSTGSFPPSLLSGITSSATIVSIC